MKVTCMRASLLLAGVAIVGSAGAADLKLTCPPELSITQSVAGPIPDGWNALSRSSSTMQSIAPGAAVATNAPPVSISVFDGPPAELADLIPDNPKAKPQRWTFPRNRPRDIYVVCNYADTRIKVTRKVPADVTSCALSTPSGPATAIICR